MDLEKKLKYHIIGIIGITVLALVYVGLVPTLVNAFTSLAALGGLGAFSTILGVILTTILGAIILLVFVFELFSLVKVAGKSAN